jgi:hypothetical protein
MRKIIIYLLILFYNSLFLCLCVIAQTTSKTVPVFSKLRWEKDEIEIIKAIVDDEVFICFDVENIADGEIIYIKILEYNKNGIHDLVKSFETVINDNKVRINTIIEFDMDQKKTQCARELYKYGYTIPQYMFIVKYNKYKSCQSNIIDIKSWLAMPAMDFPFLLIFSDGTRIKIGWNKKKTIL